MGNYQDSNWALKKWLDDPGDVTHAAWSTAEMNQLHNMENSTTAVTVSDGNSEGVTYDIGGGAAVYMHVSRVAIYCSPQTVADWTVETSLDMSSYDDAGALTDGGAYAYVDVDLGVRGIRITCAPTGHDTEIQEIIIYSDPLISDITHTSHVVFQGPANTSGLFTGPTDTGTFEDYCGSFDDNEQYLWLVDTEHPAQVEGYITGLTWIQKSHSNSDSRYMNVLSVEPVGGVYWYIRDKVRIPKNQANKPVWQGGSPITTSPTWVIDPPLRFKAGDLLMIIGPQYWSTERNRCCRTGVVAGKSFYYRTTGTYDPNIGDVLTVADYTQQTNGELMWKLVDHPDIGQYYASAGVDKLFFPNIPIAERWTTAVDGSKCVEYRFKNQSVNSAGNPVVDFWPTVSVLATATTGGEGSVTLVDAGRLPPYGGKIRLMDGTPETLTYTSVAGNVLTLSGTVSGVHAQYSYVKDYSAYIEISIDGSNWYPLGHASLPLTYGSTIAGGATKTFYVRKSAALSGYTVDAEVWGQFYVHWTVAA